MTDVESCDVLIVGGGPAGSTCAWKLRRSGLDVLILDRARFPRDKVCAGWITPQIVEELELPIAEYAKERVFQPIRGFAVSVAGGRAATVDYGEPVSFGIRRCEFDHYLLDRCLARRRLGEPLRSLRRERGTWIANDSIAAKVLVGAGGHFCPVARRLGERSGPEPVVAAQEIEYALTPDEARACAVAPELPELTFTATLDGYGWVVRKGSHVNVGFGRQRCRGLSADVDRFTAYLSERGRLPPSFPGGLRGHAYLLYGAAPRPLVAEGALLVGDAAGLAYPKSGEGIRPAVESGLLAAGAIAAAGGDPSRARLEAYARAVERRFGPREPAPSRGVSEYVPPRWRAAVARAAAANPRFARHVVLDRWFLHRLDPALPA